MLLWFLILVLTVVTVLIVARPLLWPLGTGVMPGQQDAGTLAVYKDQLAEIEADRARGMIGDAEAEAARIELSRRLLAHTAISETKVDPVPPQSAGKRASQMAIVVGLPVIALTLYAMLGAPLLPGHPQSSGQIAGPRTAKPGTADIDQLVAKVEERLRQNPDDGRGWDVIAPVYMREQRYEEARAAYARAIAQLGETPKRLTGLAESAIRAKAGMVTDEARDAFEKVLKAEPGRTDVRFWLALAREQRGDLKYALDEYRAMLAGSPPDAPWRGAVAERLAALAASVGESAPAIAPSRGPSANDVTAAAGMAPEARQQMIAGMVENLHTKLKADGRDAAGWQRLLRAYGVLGDVPKANAALAEAKRALAGDDAGLGAVEALAREMGLGT